MKIEIYAEDIDGTKRLLDIVETDSPARAIEMYDYDADDDEVIVFRHFENGIAAEERP